MRFSAVSSSNLLQMRYIKDACQMFDKMPERNVFSLTSMIGLYCWIEDYEETLRLFSVMIGEGVKPDHFIFPKVFKACSEALQVFRQMQAAGIKPNSITLASFLSACSRPSLLRHGKEIHAYCIKTDGLDLDVLVGNSPVDFYSKCRVLDVARQKFDQISQKDLISWNSMIAGYAQRGSREEAIEMLEEMKSARVDPNVVTWNSLITGFTQNGDGETALEFFCKMPETGMEPNTITIFGTLAACGQVKNSKSGKKIHGNFRISSMNYGTTKQCIPEITDPEFFKFRIPV